ncbi:unnamed protein product [Allacma fusca]|uniref:BTB domain-containing protein n=1 Tax=Allacma fusca TaxID=39272 RepID=A0A8J2JR33_9HEXA|nr:unnamed protein product [Allacma fusca]
MIQKKNVQRAGLGADSPGLSLTFIHPVIILILVRCSRCCRALSCPEAHSEQLLIYTRGYPPHIHMNTVSRKAYMGSDVKGVSPYFVLSSWVDLLSGKILENEMTPKWKSCPKRERELKSSLRTPHLSRSPVIEDSPSTPTLTTDQKPDTSEPDFSTFENKTGLAEDMKFLASMPELCDVTFLVGDTREPVCAVKAVLAARSRVFFKILYQAPSPQRKKDPPQKENKLRLFLKRSSEPLLNMQNTQSSRPSRGFQQQLSTISEPQQHQTLIIEEFEPDVFRQLIEYIHTGYVTLQPRTLLGVMNAADYYGLEELRKACVGFVQCCINVDTVCALLASAERYIQYKCTKSLVQKVLEFVDLHGTEVLNLGSFTLLPQHVVRLILVREELKADEFTKFQAALMWSKKYCDNNPEINLKDTIGNFLEYIQFHKIPANVLMKDIHPLGVVPYHIVMNALAYQADPTSVDPAKLSPNRARRSTGGRSMSVQSSLDPYGSNTTLASTGSSEMDSGRISSGGGADTHSGSPHGRSSS